MNNEKKVRKQRIWELDFFRGFAILAVVWDHFMYDCYTFRKVWANTGNLALTNLGKLGYDYLTIDLRVLIRPVFLFIFFCTSGLCTALSRNNLLRGLKLGGVAAGVSLVTFLIERYAMEGVYIRFGVLHCIAVIILLYAILTYIVEGGVRLGYHLAKKEYNEKFKKYFLAGLCIALSIAFYFIDREFNVHQYDVMRYYSTVEAKNALTGLFFFTDDWATADYFPLFPYICYFFLGAGLAQFLYPNKKSLMPSLDWWWNKPFTVMGRYSLLIYLSTQVVAIGVLALVTKLLTGVSLLF